MAAAHSGELKATWTRERGVGYIDLEPGAKPRKSKVNETVDDLKLVLDFTDDRLVGIEFMDDRMMPARNVVDALADIGRAPTSDEMDAARWIGRARALLQVLLRQKTTVGNEHLMRELVETPWPDKRDWDEMIVAPKRFKCGRCGTTHTEAEWATFSTVNGPDGFPDHYKVR